ncbi:hypothetical protein LAUMK13_05799 [Mycobacterium innocens]|uniref:Uncharacterized protein n=1 Tax=Mycobacterium innocens TaxID=2341083 RepID=A0A498QQY2_9MYCO|nr:MULTISPECIES: hypothetical protein [Mycobacterium]VBA47392.1 hypothetical protein LAUMK13_05799 [Mycobacterium innocens]
MSYPQAPEGFGWIALTTQYFPLAFMLALFKPTLVIDGYQVPVGGWGRAVVPARRGPHHVHVHVPYWLPSRIGPAGALLDVYPGGLVQLEYKAPVWGTARVRWAARRKATTASASPWLCSPSDLDE